MSLRTILIGVFALVFGVAAAVGVFLITRARIARPEAELVPVVVASADVPRGQSLTEDLLELRRWPKDSVPEGAISEISAALERTVLSPLARGELLLEAKLAAKGAGRGLAAIIPPGMRAVTIQTPNIATGVAGFILPGNKVDVLLTLTGTRADDPTGGGSTIVLLQNVEILAVDQRIDAPQGNRVDPKELRSITLMVSPAHAALLDLGQNKGTLHLALRNPADQATAAVEPATLSGLHIDHPEARVVSRAPAPPVVQPKVERKEVAAAEQAKLARRVRTMRGLQSSEVEFPSPNAAEANDLLPEPEGEPSDGMPPEGTSPLGTSPFGTPPKGTSPDGEGPDSERPFGERATQ